MDANFERKEILKRKQFLIDFKIQKEIKLERGQIGFESKIDNRAQCEGEI